jgi:hypothetical protein
LSLWYLQTLLTSQCQIDFVCITSRLVIPVITLLQD